MSALRGLLTRCKLHAGKVPTGARLLAHQAQGPPRESMLSLSQVVPAPVKSEEIIAKIGSIIPSIPDQLNPIHNFDYSLVETFPIGLWPNFGRAGAITGEHAVGGAISKFPYFHERNACYNEDAVITDLVEVIPNTSEKHSPIDMWLDGFEFPDLPKGKDEVYRVKGTRFGETGPGADFFRYKYDIPVVEDAWMFWRKYGTFKSETLPEEQFEAMWMHFFRNPLLDKHELHRGCNLIHDFDMVPDPLLVEQMFYACRRLDYYSMTIRILEAIKDKIPYDPEVYKWFLQELGPVMEELGIVTPDSLGLHTAPEGKGYWPY